MPISNNVKHLPKRDTNKQKPISDYINNEEFLQAILEHKEQLKEWREGKRVEKPLVSEYLGRSFWKLAENYSYNRSFIKYPFRQDMVMDAVYFCLKYIDTFNPEKTKNPFAYFTTACHNAFLQKIEKEKKYLYTKYKAIENSEIFNEEGVEDGRKKPTSSNDGITDYSQDKRNEFVEKFEKRLEEKRLEKENKDKKKAQENVINEETTNET